MKELRKSLPANVEVAGEEKVWDTGKAGFVRNISKDIGWRTDGHLCFRTASAHPAAVARIKDDHLQEQLGSMVDSFGVEKMWKDNLKKEGANLALLGCARHGVGVYAVLRAEDGRIATCNPYKLAFAWETLQADGVAGTYDDLEHEPLRLTRGKEIVGLLMPTRIFAAHLRDYDLNGEPIGIAEAIAASPTAEIAS